MTTLDDTPIDVPILAPLAAVPLPSDWTQQVDRIRGISREPFIAAPSGQAAAYLGLQPTAGPAAAEALPDATATTETSVAADARAARDGRPLGRAVHAALDQVVRIGIGVTPAQIAVACSTAASDEGVLTQVNEVHARVTAGVASDLMQQALAAPRRWSELYLAAPVDAAGVRLVEGFADLLFESADGLVLVDYKTDEAIGPETRQHYAEQLAAYAELIERATRMTVTARRILHLTPEETTAFDV